jgi:hypothetical protein
MLPSRRPSRRAKAARLSFTRQAKLVSHIPEEENDGAADQVPRGCRNWAPILASFNWRDMYFPVVVGGGRLCENHYCLSACVRTNRGPAASERHQATTPPAKGAPRLFHLQEKSLNAHPNTFCLILFLVEERADPQPYDSKFSVGIECERNMTMAKISLNRSGHPHDLITQARNTETHSTAMGRCGVL